MYSKIISALLGKPHHHKREKEKNAAEVKCFRGGNNSLTAGGHASFTSSDSAPCEHCGSALSHSTSGTSSTELMGHKDFVMRWNVKYIGSFPISNTTPDHVAFRLDKFQSKCQATPAVVAVSMMGVRVHSDDKLLLSHSLRRVVSVVGRPSLREVAYIALEPAGQTYRRQCHVFRTQEMHNVEEIEAVLGSAFQAALARSRLSQVNSTATSTPIQSMSEKRASSTAFLSRLMGRSGKDTTVTDEDKSKRKRRPVSAVFSAFQRFSSSATISNSGHKRMTSYEPLSSHFHETPSTRTVSSSSPVPEEPVPSNRLSKISGEAHPLPPPPTLVFDKDIGEEIYPVDEALRSQLEHVNYFVKLPSRELLVRNLLQHPDGAFVVRLSESKKNCLVLSVKVPQSHNPSCISHYVIIRNEAGYRIKGFPKTFPSLQMLVTHHSVLPEQLPVTLSFVQWNKEDWRQQLQQQQPRKDPLKEHHRLSRNSYYDENRIPDWMHHHATPRRRPISTARHSRIFELE